MLARTDRGREVRLYFIDVEKRYQREMGQMTPLEATVQKLGEFVMNELRKLDHVGYVRFASVYRSFEDVDEFRQLIRDI
jgi:transcriptional repressor NrdR